MKRTATQAGLDNTVIPLPWDNYERAMKLLKDNSYETAIPILQQ